MALRKGLPSNMLQADGASTMRNLTVVVAWHGGSPKVSTSCTNPSDSTLSLENPRRQALTGSSFSLAIPILSKVDVKMMLVELPLSTRTLWIVYWLLWILSQVGCHGDVGSLPCRSLKRLWYYSAEEVWIRFVLLRFPLIRCCASGPSWLSWTLHLLQTLQRSHGFLLKATDDELGLADEVVVAGLVLAFLRPRNG